MLRIYIELQEIDLLPGTSMQIELNNPLFDAENDKIKGGFSLPFTIPLTDKNRVIFGFPDVIDNTVNVRREFTCYLEADGETLQGLLKLRRIEKKKITANVMVGISAIGKSLQERKLNSFEFGGIREMGGSTPEAAAHMNLIASYPDDSDYTFAPIKNTIVFGEGKLDDFFKDHIINDFKNNTFVLTPGNTTTRPRGLCPLPKLRYVLLQALRELALQVEESFFDAELSRLFIISNAGLERIMPSAVKVGETEVAHYETEYKYFFRIADLVPDLTLIDLLRKLAVTFGLSPQVSLNNKLILAKLNDIIESLDYLECSHLASDAGEDINDQEAFNFFYKTDNDDAEPGTHIADFEDITVLEPVPSYKFLQDTFRKDSGTAEPRQVRFIEDIKQYYIYKYTYNQIGWFYYSDNYAPVKTAAAGTDIPQGIAPVICSIVDWNGEPTLLPVMQLKRTLPNIALNNPTPELRLLFYRGFQPYPVQNKIYPLLTDDVFNAKGEKIGDYSLRLDGEHGTYAKFLKPWYNFKSSSRSIRKKIAWSMVDLANLNMNRKLAIDGNLYLVRKVTFSLPVRKPVDAELVLCKKEI